MRTPLKTVEAFM